MSKKPIGVFDSGVGGLTILRELKKQFPHEDFIYFGDTAHVPYGTKSKKTVTQYAAGITHFLQTQQVKLIIVACNTASALALPTLRKNFPIPILGVIEAGARAAVNATQNGKIAILGTNATINSKAYVKSLLRLEKNLKIIQQACPLFVPLVEANWHKKPAADLIAREYLAPVIKNGTDTVILGCTHYPLLKTTLSKILGKQVKLIDSATTLATQTRNILIKNRQAQTEGKGKTVFFASDEPARFKKMAEQILQAPIGKVTLKKLNG